MVCPVGANDRLYRPAACNVKSRRLYDYQNLIGRQMIGRMPDKTKNQRVR